MFNFEFLFLHGFSSKNREILHKAILTPQEYEDYFLEKKLRKNGGKIKKKHVGGVPASQDWPKKTSRQNNFFLEKARCAKTPPNGKKMV